MSILHKTLNNAKCIKNNIFLDNFWSQTKSVIQHEGKENITVQGVL